MAVVLLHLLSKHFIAVSLPLRDSGIGVTGLFVNLVVIYAWVVAIACRVRDFGIPAAAGVSIYIVYSVSISYLSPSNIIPGHLFLIIALSAWPGDVGSNPFGSDPWPVASGIDPCGASLLEGHSDDDGSDVADENCTVS
jgi:hypothetical protein